MMEYGGSSRDTRDHRDRASSSRPLNSSTHYSDRSNGSNSSVLGYHSPPPPLRTTTSLPSNPSAGLPNRPTTTVQSSSNPTSSSSSSTTTTLNTTTTKSIPTGPRASQSNGYHHHQHHSMVKFGVGGGGIPTKPKGSKSPIPNLPLPTPLSDRMTNGTMKSNSRTTSLVDGGGGGGEIDRETSLKEREREESKRLERAERFGLMIGTTTSNGSSGGGSASRSSRNDSPRSTPVPHHPSTKTMTTSTTRPSHLPMALSSSKGDKSSTATTTTTTTTGFQIPYRSRKRTREDQSEGGGGGGRGDGRGSDTGRTSSSRGGSSSSRPGSPDLRDHHHHHRRRREDEGSRERRERDRSEGGKNNRERWRSGEERSGSTSASLRRSIDSKGDYPLLRFPGDSEHASDPSLLPPPPTPLRFRRPDSPSSLPPNPSAHHHHHHSTFEPSTTTTSRSRRSSSHYSVERSVDRMGREGGSSSRGGSITPRARSPVGGGGEGGRERSLDRRERDRNRSQRDREREREREKDRDTSSSTSSRKRDRGEGGRERGREEEEDRHRSRSHHRRTSRSHSPDHQRRRRQEEEDSKERNVLSLKSHASSLISSSTRRRSRSRSRSSHSQANSRASSRSRNDEHRSTTSSSSKPARHHHQQQRRSSPPPPPTTTSSSSRRAISRSPPPLPPPLPTAPASMRDLPRDLPTGPSMRKGPYTSSTTAGGPRNRTLNLNGAPPPGFLPRRPQSRNESLLSRESVDSEQGRRGRYGDRDTGRKNSGGRDEAVEETERGELPSDTPPRRTSPRPRSTIASERHHDRSRPVSPVPSSRRRYSFSPPRNTSTMTERESRLSLLGNNGASKEQKREEQEEEELEEGEEKEEGEIVSSPPPPPAPSHRPRPRISSNPPLPIRPPPRSNQTSSRSPSRSTSHHSSKPDMVEETQTPPPPPPLAVSPIPPPLPSSSGPHDDTINDSSHPVTRSHSPPLDPTKTTTQVGENIEREDGETEEGEIVSVAEDPMPIREERVRVDKEEEEEVEAVVVEKQGVEPEEREEGRIDEVDDKVETSGKTDEIPKEEPVTSTTDEGQDGPELEEQAIESSSPVEVAPVVEAPEADGTISMEVEEAQPIEKTEEASSEQVDRPSTSNSELTMDVDNIAVVETSPIEPPAPVPLEADVAQSLSAPALTGNATSNVRSSPVPPPVSAPEMTASLPQLTSLDTAAKTEVVDALPSTSPLDHHSPPQPISPPQKHRLSIASDPEVTTIETSTDPAITKISESHRLIDREALFATTWEESAENQERLLPFLIEGFEERDQRRGEKMVELRKAYRILDDDWQAHVKRLDKLKERLQRKSTSKYSTAPQTPSIDASGMPYYPEPATPGPSVLGGGRGNRRGGGLTNSTWGYGDAVRSEAEFLEILASLENADLRDPDVRAARTAAVVPDMVVDPAERAEIISCTFDDDRYRVDDPIETYGIQAPMELWTEAEVETFCKRYAQHPKQFGKIAQGLPDKTMAQCVVFYYRMKNAIDFRSLSERRGRDGRRKKTKKRPGEGKGKGSSLLSNLKGAKSTMLDERDDDEEDDGQLAPPSPNASRLSLSGNSSSLIASRTSATPRPLPAASLDPPFDDDYTPSTSRTAARATRLPGSQLHSEGMMEAAEVLGALAGRPGDEGDEATPTSLRPRAAKSNRKVRMDLDDEGAMETPSNEKSKPKRKTQTNSYWSAGEKTEILRLLEIHGKNWKAIADELENKTAVQCKNWFTNNAKKLGLRTLVNGIGVQEEEDESPAMTPNESPAVPHRRSSLLAQPSYFPSSQPQDLPPLPAIPSAAALSASAAGMHLRNMLNEDVPDEEGSNSAKEDWFGGGIDEEASNATEDGSATNSAQVSRPATSGGRIDDYGRASFTPVDDRQHFRHSNEVSHPPSSVLPPLATAALDRRFERFLTQPQHSRSAPPTSTSHFSPSISPFAPYGSPATPLSVPTHDPYRRPTPSDYFSVKNALSQSHEPHQHRLFTAPQARVSPALPSSTFASRPDPQPPTLSQPPSLGWRPIERP